jgi:chitin disaccharide deacetylase
MKKYVVLVSDDFGMCHSVNLGINHVLTKGLVKTSNFMVPCPWFNEAMALAKKNDLKIGIHLTMTCDWDVYRWGPVTKARSICDEQGFFYPNYAELHKHAKDEEIYNEYRAQIKIVQDIGFNFTHLDSHMIGDHATTEAEYRVFDILLKVADDTGLLYNYDKRDGKLQHFESHISMSGSTLEATIKMIENMTPGFHLFTCHVANGTDELSSLCSEDYSIRHWASDYRLDDMEKVSHPDFAKAIKDNDIELINMEDYKSIKGM